MTAMTIGQAAKQAGVGVETIRFYERKGLIAQPPRPPGGGFRAYSQEAVSRIRFIKQAQELGFSLKEAADLLVLRAEGGVSAEVKQRAQAKLRDVDRKIEQLGQIRGALRALLDTCPGAGSLAQCTIMRALDGDREDQQPTIRIGDEPARGRSTRR